LFNIAGGPHSSSRVFCEHVVFLSVGSEHATRGFAFVLCGFAYTHTSSSIEKHFASKSFALSADAVVATVVYLSIAGLSGLFAHCLVDIAWSSVVG